MVKIAIGALALILAACSPAPAPVVAPAQPVARAEQPAPPVAVASEVAIPDPPAAEHGEPPAHPPQPPPAPPVAKISQLVATPVSAPMSKAPKGLYDALVTRGKRWELTNGEEKLVVENYNVRKVGNARVAELRWAMGKGKYSGGWPRLVIVKKSGLVVLDSLREDSNIKKLVKSKPQYADPPRLNQKNRAYYAQVLDDMVCLGFDFWAKKRGEGDICGDESCLWRMCLGPEGIVGADDAGASSHAPARFGLPGRPKSARLEAIHYSSSEHKAWKGYEFTADQLGDRDLATSWQPAKGKAVGEWVEVRAGHSEMPPVPVKVDAIEIANGYQTRDKLGDLFAANARARQVTIALDGKPVAVVELGEKQRGYVRIDLGGQVAENVRLTIDSIWPGKKWQDVAISEVAIIGRWPN